MKRFLLSIIIFCTIINITVAQEQAGSIPVAVPAAQGVWVYLGNSIPRNMHYQIERSKGDSKRFEKLGETTAPTSEQEMKDRQLSFSKYFEKLDPINDKTINRLWQSTQKYPKADSLFSNNLPMMHLMAGTAYFDATAEKNENYVYRINLIASDGKSISTKESNATAQFKKASLPKINFESCKYAEGKLVLTWSVKDPLRMSHFNVYRTIFGKEEYAKISIERGVYSENNNLMLLAIDTIGNKPAWYEYKIAAVDAYGNEGELQAIASGGNVEDYYAPPITNLKAINTNSNHEVKLSWRLEKKKYLNGINVMRSTLFDSGYQRIATLPVSDTSFTDIVPLSGENYYYYLQILSANDKPVSSAKVFAAYSGDKSVPQPPKEIDATSQPKGIKVYWKSDEPFAKGFYVYRRDNTTVPFVLISPLIASRQPIYSFSDTSQQLQAGGVYQYIVRTISDNNQLSKPSDTVSANPGIKKAMTPPTNLRFRENNGMLTLLWDDMRNWESNLMGYKVYRKTSNGAFVKMDNDSLKSERNFFEDSELSSGTSYVYGVKTFDNSGSESEMATISFTAVGELLAGPPSGISVSQTGDNVFITWGQISGDIVAIKIYKSEKGIQPKLIATITDVDSYTDKNVFKGKLYFYQLSTVGKSNKEGAQSEKISIRVK